MTAEETAKAHEHNARKSQGRNPTLSLTVTLAFSLDKQLYQGQPKAQAIEHLRVFPMTHSSETSNPTQGADKLVTQVASRRPYQAPSLRVDALHAVVRSSTTSGAPDVFGSPSS